MNLITWLELEERWCSVCRELRPINRFAWRPIAKVYRRQCHDCLVKKRARRQALPGFGYIRRRDTQKYRWARKIRLINHYGGQCACCGETILYFLHIDHI